MTDLVNRELVRDENTTVSLIPFVTVRDQVEPAHGGGQRSVQLVVEGESGSLLDQFQK